MRCSLKAAALAAFAVLGAAAPAGAQLRALTTSAGVPSIAVSGSDVLVVKNDRRASRLLAYPIAGGASVTRVRIPATSPVRAFITDVQASATRVAFLRVRQDQTGNPISMSCALRCAIRRAASRRSVVAGSSSSAR